MKESIVLKDVFTISDRSTGGTVAGSSSSGDPANPVRDRWTKVGVGFVNRDNSINVILDAIPVNGRLQIRDRQAPKQNMQSTQARR